MQIISIVIVNWNGYQDTLRCLDSIQRMTVPIGYTLRTIVVDNGSTNASADRISKAHSWVTLITLPKNLGFTGGNNVGMKYAMEYGSDFVWLLNNDTLVDLAAAKLVEAFADSSVGIAGSKIYFAPGHEYHADRYEKNEIGRVFWYAGGRIDWQNMYASHHGVDEVDRGQYDTLVDTPFVTGCSMMIHRSVIETIGYLDDKFYLYLEDLDYSLRAHAHGFRIVYEPKSVLWHVNAGSSGGAGNPLHEYYITRNRLLVGMRYAPIRTKVALIKEAISFLLHGSNIKKQAIGDALRGRWGNRYEFKKNT